ncbi:TonB-dependent receptor [Alteromonas mediterranea]|uniref:Ligand-gated channel protein n=1 Tax=Alteromonas mediterranea TaxID=314275 RepID=A0AAC8XNT7_9ALTE|nr:TonB-dependent receptor [Alteromonas mediterranea]AFV87294.1 putative TonB-dependent receptor protein [Alteromonas mediterranea DE1]AGP99310.1 TonB-dependent receptor protein [Alteromonas mediterranea UM7]AGQ03470.1 TonB-dependent receptor protein [Alteromonas mediterranea UM4b]AMJ80189.1 ligand-gated channel protein [Alteromonas mediterranea]AMJ84345.1 ligand-gated channel protein [Alteromonas mediterranea]
MRLPSLFPMSLFTASLLTTMAAAQEANEIERIETTSSRIQGQITATGYAVSSISEETLSMLSFQHIQESLNYIAGAGVQRGNGQEYLPALRSPVLTGAGACGGILAAEDGIPLRAAGFCNINELFEAHGEVAERIDVIKGPASALYGSNAIHGVINVITPDTTQGTGQLALDYGSYGFHRAKLQQGKDFGSSGVGIAASLTRDTGYRDDEGVDQEKVSLRHRIEWDSTVITSGLTYTHLDQETAGYIEGFESYKSTELARSNPNPEAFRNAKSLRIWSKFNTSFDGGHGLSITPYLRNQDMRFRMHFLPGKPLEENAQKGVGVLSQFNYIVNDYVSLDLGIDAEYTEGELVQSQQGATEGSAFLVETIPSGKHYDYDVDAALIAPFFALNWQHEKWDVSLGGRFESMQYDYTNNMNVGRVREDGTQCGFGGCRYSRPADSSNDFDSFSPKLSLRYQLNGSTQLFGGLARGYRAPQATELYRLQRAQEVTDLDSVTADNIEVGITGTTDRGSYTLSFYSLEKDNVIYRDSNFFNVSNGETWHRGVELSFNQKISDVLRVDFAGTYARHTYEHSQITGELDIKGNDMDTAPKVQLNTRLNYDVTRNIQAQIEWQHVASYYTDAENLNEYDGHDLVHARVRFNVNNDITLHARINNVFDTKYAERADFTSFTGPRYFPGRPRNFMLSATFAL